MPPTKKAHVELIFDISSPYSNLAFRTLSRYKEPWNLDLELTPIFLGGIMVATGNTAPSNVAASAPHLNIDTKRISDYYGVDVRSPPGHPMKTSSLNIMRFLRALKEEESPEVLAECVRIIYLEFYSVQTDSSSRAFLKCLVPVLGDARLEEIRAISQTLKHKDGVKADVQKVVKEYGMFGAPWILATNPETGKTEGFFGNDKIEDVGWWLGPEYVWRGPYPNGRPVPININEEKAHL